MSICVGSNPQTQVLEACCPEVTPRRAAGRGIPLSTVQFHTRKLLVTGSTTRNRATTTDETVSRAFVGECSNWRTAPFRAGSGGDDLETVATTIELVRFAGDPPVAVVLNGVPPRGRKRDQATDVLENDCR